MVKCPRCQIRLSSRQSLYNHKKRCDKKVVKIPAFKKIVEFTSDEFGPDGVKSMETLNKLKALVNKPPVVSPSYQDSLGKYSKDAPVKKSNSTAEPIPKSITEPRLSTKELAKIVKPIPKPSHKIGET